MKQINIQLNKELNKQILDEVLVGRDYIHAKMPIILKTAPHLNK